VPRRVLGIETSTLRCEIAVADERGTVAAMNLPVDSKPTATLIPSIRQLCEQVSWLPRDFDLVCIDVGPGSYTGLRVGLTCAKTLAFAAHAALATAESTNVIARRVPVTGSFLDVVLDAARGQVFCQRFHAVEATPPSNLTVSQPRNASGSSDRLSSDRSDDHRDSPSTSEWAALGPIDIIPADAWAQKLTESTVVAGPALVKYRHLVTDRSPMANESLWWPSAAHVIERGVEQFRTAPLRSFWTLEPLYMRPSAAEEKKTFAIDT
jgi:tRNA threonylcarbamoyl adenosine modification protein YeaZ